MPKRPKNEDEFSGGQSPGAEAEASPGGQAPGAEAEASPGGQSPGAEAEAGPCDDLGSLPLDELLASTGLAVKLSFHQIPDLMCLAEGLEKLLTAASSECDDEIILSRFLARCFAGGYQRKA